MFDGQAVHIPNSPDSLDYDLFHSNSAAPTVVNKLPQPTMSIFRAPKHRPRMAKAPQPSKAEKPEKAAARSLTAKPSGSTPRLAAVPDRDVGSVDDEDGAIANLKSSYAKVHAEKRENAYVWRQQFLKGAEADLFQFYNHRQHSASQGTQAKASQAKAFRAAEQQLLSISPWKSSLRPSCVTITCSHKHHGPGSVEAAAVPNHS